VLIQGDRIVAVAPSHELPSPNGAHHLDFPRGTLLPGLFDAHTHLAFDAGPDPVATVRRSTDGVVLAIARRSAATALRSGITTVRDCGGPREVIHRLKSEQALAAEPTLRVLAAGRALTTVRGHCWFFDGEAADGDALVSEVQMELERGADHLKIMATGGGITPGTDPSQPQFTVDDLTRATHAAHAAGRPVGCHAHGARGIANAARAGVDIIDHASFITPEGPRFDPAVADLMARNGCRVTCTFATMARPLASGEMVGNMRKLPLSPRQYFEARVEVARQLRARGIILLAGSDAGDVNVGHDAVLTEMAMLVQVGLSPEEAVAAASWEPARALGVSDEIGSVEPGKLADVLVVDGNLSADIGNARNTRYVLRAGRPVL
jgi:imidazolonepropionase-like amidohydrolase